MTPAIAAELAALRAQRNREADAVATLNGRVAELEDRLRGTTAALEDARAELDTLRRMETARGGE